MKTVTFAFALIAAGLAATSAAPSQAAKTDVLMR